MSRRMLDKLALSEDLSPSRRARLQRELAHAGRVEFTVVTEVGQDKGWWMICVTRTAVRVDFLLPKDTKGEISLTVGGVLSAAWQGADAAGRAEPHQPPSFFDEGQLQEWLGQEGDLFAAGLNGDVVAAMHRLGDHTSLAEIESWPLREYLTR
jgi:hypothetical protein